VSYAEPSSEDLTPGTAMQGDPSRSMQAISSEDALPARLDNLALMASSPLRSTSTRGAAAAAGTKPSPPTSSAAATSSSQPETFSERFFVHVQQNLASMDATLKNQGAVRLTFESSSQLSERCGQQNRGG
jgi:hypothetical protein